MDSADLPEDLTYRLSPPGPNPAGQEPGGPRGPRDGREPLLAPLTGPHPLPPPPKESFTVRRPPLPPPGRISDGPSWPAPTPTPNYADSPSGGGLLPAIPPRITSPGGPLAGLGGPDFPPRPGPDRPDRPGPGGTSEPPRRRAGALAVIAGVAAVVVIGAIIGIVVTTRGPDDAATTPVASAPANAVAPLGPTDGASPEQPSAPPAGNPEDALRALLNPVTMTGCEAPQRSDSSYADATLRCIGAEGVEVLAYHFPDRSALDRQIGARETYYTDSGNCDDGQESSEQWSSPQEPNGGTRLCYRYADQFVTLWSINDSLVAFAAADQDPGRLIAWWRGFDPIRR